MRHIFIPLPFNLHGHLNPHGFFSEILTQSVRVLTIFEGAKILPKCPTFWEGATASQTTYRRQTDDSCQKANSTW